MYILWLLSSFFETRSGVFGEDRLPTLWPVLTNITRRKVLINAQFRKKKKNFEKWQQGSFL